MPPGGDPTRPGEGRVMGFAGLLEYGLYVLHVLAAVVFGVAVWVIVAGTAMWLIARRPPEPPDLSEWDGDSP